jgi:hypothetical protein
VRRLLAFASVALFAAQWVACASAPPRPAKPPPVDPETRLVPTPPEKEAEPRILAPPPAYGNKIVMARAGAARRL